MDFWQATRSLPGYGLRNEGNDNFHMTPAGSDLRVLMTLQTLEAITRKYLEKTSQVYRVSPETVRVCQTLTVLFQLLLPMPEEIPDFSQKSGI